jgi:hypothetical protein
MAYATLDETYNLALTARAFVVGASKIDSVEIATGKIRLPSHGCTAADLLLFSYTSGGSLPAELDAFTYYSPIIVGGDVFKVAHPTTGLPIVFTTTPSGWAVKVDPARRLTMHLRDAFGRINNCITAHSTPILVDPITGLYPPILVGMNARMAARSCVTSLQIENPQYREALDRLFALEADDEKTLAEWKDGKPILPKPTDQTDSVPEMGAMATFARRASAWSTGRVG